MQVIGIAVAIGLVLWVVFVMVDKRKRRVDQDVNAAGQVTHKGKDKPDREGRAASKSGSKSDKDSILAKAGGVIDYSIYRLSLVERLSAIILAGVMLGAIGIIFYKNVIMAVLLALLGLLYPKLRRKQLMQKRKDELSLQFKQALYSLSSSLAAGKSVENAFREVLKDLRLLYPDPSTYILREFEIINNRVATGEPIEAALQDFSARADIEDIANFADVFVTCKRSGGDIVEVIRRTANIIGEKLEIKQDISVMIAQKKFEARALGIIPFGLVALLGYMSADYMAPLYTGVGYVIMTVALVILIGALFLIQRIMNIKV
ncbi:type II secretion system F family protein [Paenibacillus sp. UMB4589-SE434]|uniref:type II secretion system F family protein n=1 Tax=Paenibacillus sp. UMB4589-SE434 TaxID=3046314 RepID=UPI00254FB030|nr:type II secretion system F family protein [Paenibacillus sp. UMB4589-SE434]MDK8181843.1 type II secretion system F family protein [Paenibacillus sp. UMB4589-SE434]